MGKVFFLTIAVFSCLIGPTIAAEQVFVAAGEHGSFSRTVIGIGADNIRLEHDGRTITLHDIDQSATYFFPILTTTTKQPALAEQKLFKRNQEKHYRFC